MLSLIVFRWICNEIDNDKSICLEKTYSRIRGYGLADPMLKPIKLKIILEEKYYFPVHYLFG